jgi:hypothetical protein
MGCKLCTNDYLHAVGERPSPYGLTLFLAPRKASRRRFTRSVSGIDVTTLANPALVWWTLKWSPMVKAGLVATRRRAQGLPKKRSMRLTTSRYPANTSKEESSHENA